MNKTTNTVRITSSYGEDDPDVNNENIHATSSNHP